MLGAFIDRVGEEFKGLRIVRELGRDYIDTECTLCGYKSVKRKSFLIRGKFWCKNCKGTAEGLIGEKFRSLKIVGIETVQGFVVCKCEDCGIEDMYRLASLRLDVTLCKHCGLTKNIKSTVGNIYGNFIIVRELGSTNKISYVTAKCMSCGSINEYRKQQLQKMKVRCKSCRVRSRLGNGL